MINEQLISLSVSSNTRDEVLQELATIAKDQGKVSDLDTYISAVLKREDEYSTAVGFNVAIPHGKSEAVNEAFFMYGRVHQVDWSALDGEPVDHVFLIGVPAAEAGNTHLQILAKLSRKLMKEEFRAALRAASDVAEVMNLFRENELI